jgi:hypothetical protein
MPLIALEHGHGDGQYEPVSLGAGVWLPDRFRVLLDDPARPLTAIVDMAVDAQGAVHVVAVAQHPRPGVSLMPDDFRLPVGRLVETALAALALRGPVRPQGARLTEHELLADAVGVVGEVLRGRRRRVLTPALLAEVAAVYRDARRDGTPVRVAVAQRWIIPENTARNWIAAARREGLIPG